MDKVILFDGECNFCNKNVLFIIKRDPHAQFKFASLQSHIGQQLLKDFNVPKDENSFILVEQSTFYSKSTAALRISKRLTSFWRLFYVFIFIPKPVRDFVYRFIAKHRNKLLNNNAACILPVPEIKKRFLS